MIPLITIDLQSLNPSYKSKVPVVYYEKTDIQWVVSKLDENNKITEMIFYDYNGKSHDIDQLMKAYINQCTIDGETYYFEEDRETTQEGLNKYKTKNFHIILDQVIGEDESVETLGDYDNCLDKWFDEFREINSLKDYINITGPYPYPGQVWFTYPIIEKTEEPFFYVININASDLGLCDFSYYIFYNPEERMVAQLMQFT